MKLTNESEFQKIMRKTGRKPVECKCQVCKTQCQRAPCLGTPQDIEKLIDAGYGDKLKGTGWAAGIAMGITKHIVPMIQLEQTPSGCIMFENGLCKLHASGLKPTEGKLSHHTLTIENYDPRKSLSVNVAKTWLDPENTSVLESILLKMT